MYKTAERAQNRDVEKPSPPSSAPKLPLFPERQRGQTLGEERGGPPRPAGARGGGGADGGSKAADAALPARRLGAARSQVTDYLPMTIYLLVAVYPSDSALPSQRSSD
jgi:hypothetical protein